MTIQSCKMIRGLIIDYANNYVLPHEIDKIEALKTEYGITEEGIVELSGQLEIMREKVSNLIWRFVFEKEVGEYLITERASSKSCCAKVTFFSMTLGREIYTAWLDSCDNTYLLAKMQIQCYQTLPSGEVWAPLCRPGTVVDKRRPLHGYASSGAGSVFINNLDAYGRDAFHGIGTGCMQVAAERSFDSGFDGRVMLLAIEQSPGFYRKMHFTTGSKETDAPLDSELLQAQIEKREPKLEAGYCMCLDEKGREKYREIIARKPILWGAGAGSAKGAKEESKSSKS